MTLILTYKRLFNRQGATKVGALSESAKENNKTNDIYSHPKGDYKIVNNPVISLRTLRLCGKGLFFLGVTLLILLASLSSAFAGNITFTFELRDNQCVVVNKGDSAAYYPVVLQLGRDGQWLPLNAAARPAELLPGGTLTADLGDVPAGAKSDISSLRVVMIRFFDQAGVSFGQVSALRSPPQSRYAVKSGYADGRLTLEAPPKDSGIRATWVLAPFEEGIRPISGALPFTYNQPPATRIEWQQKRSAEIDTGAALPVAMLLHETADGVTLQIVQAPRTKKIEQRTAWLYMRRFFYSAAAFFGLCGILLCMNKSVCKR
jgi:hypothetical protein